MDERRKKLRKGVVEENHHRKQAECVQMKTIHAKFGASRSTTKKRIILTFKGKVYENKF